MMTTVLGDFAVLLRAGMTIKQALICNLISSLLCLLGVLVGLAIGSTHATAPWIFASTAGLFLYIALVDMVRLFAFQILFVSNYK